MTDDSQPADDPDRLLSIYLRDHLAGAEAGLALAGRSRQANEANRVGEALAAIEAEIAEDRQALVEIMERLDVSKSEVKMLIGKAAELLGRITTNATITRYSPSSRLLELEALLAGVTAKRGLWSSLLQAAPSRPELEESTLKRLVARATSQLDRLTAEHEWAARDAFSRTKSQTSGSRRCRGDHAARW